MVNDECCDVITDQYDYVINLCNVKKSYIYKLVNMNHISWNSIGIWTAVRYAQTNYNFYKHNVGFISFVKQRENVHFRKTCIKMKCKKIRYK